jgi:hypothetical protein
VNVKRKRLGYQLIIAGGGEPLVCPGIETFHELDSGRIGSVSGPGYVVPFDQIRVEFYALFHE